MTTMDVPVTLPLPVKKASPSIIAPTIEAIQPKDGYNSLLKDLKALKHLYANNHLSDVLFVFPSENTTSSATNEQTGKKHDAKTTTEIDDDNTTTNTPEQHLLPAHRLILALRSGTFEAALLRTKSSQVPSQMRFPLKIHIQDTSFRVFATLLRYLYTNEVVVDGISSTKDAIADDGRRLEFWKELMRAAYVYVVPSLVDICVEQIERILSGEKINRDGSEDVVGDDDDVRDLQLLKKILDFLIFSDGVLATNQVTTRRRTSKQQASRSSGTSSDFMRLSENGHIHDHDLDESQGQGRCMGAIVQLQELCMSKLETVPERLFEALIYSDVGKRCSTLRLCDILRQRSDNPLVVAIRYQLGRVVNELLRSGEPLDQVSSDETDLPLVAALKTGNDAIIRRLLVDEDAPYFLLTDKIPLFFLACASGNVLHCQILIDQNNANVNLMSQLDDGDKQILTEYGHRQTPLHIASRRKHTKVVELLLDNKAVSNLQDEEGNTPLHCAQNVETAEVLLNSAYKTNPNIPNRRGQTPLHVAAAHGSVGIVDLLLRHDAERDAMDDQGQTAFHVAAANGHTSVALILLHQGDPFQMQQRPESTLQKKSSDVDGGAQEAPNDENSEAEHDDEVHPNGFDINQEDLKGNTALHLAAMSPSERCQKMLQLLLENGANPNRSNWFGYTPLHLFCAHQSGPASVIELFIEHGANIHTQSLDGSTALHLAVGRASEEVAVALVIAGAHVHLLDAAGRSVVDLAEGTNQGTMLVPVLRNLAHPPEWVGDDQVKECSSCRTAFRVAMRKHHCRHCGRIVCYNCSSNKIAIPKFQLLQATRVCDTCYDVLSFRRLL